MARVESEDLAFFRTVVSSRSLADAARLLGVSPAAVTQRLQHIEARLGTRLINRSTRRLILTEDGAVVLKSSQALLAGLNDLHEELEAAKACAPDYNILLAQDREFDIASVRFAGATF